MKKGIFLAIFIFVSFVFSQPEVDLKGRSDGQSTLVVDCPHTGDDSYDDSTGINVSDSGTYNPVDARSRPITIHGLILTHGTGHIAITLEGGGKMQLPYNIDSLDCREVLMGYEIKSIDSSGTTFSGSIFPLF